MGKDLKGKELGENISQRKDGRYCARYVDRFGKRKSIYDNNLKELKQRLRQAIYEDEKKINVIDDKITLDEWFEKWMDIYKNPVIRPSTKRHYEHIYKKHISQRLGNLPLNEITQLQIKSLINKLDDMGYQWETQNKTRVILTDLFERALEDDFVRKNPARGVRLAKNKPNERFILSVEAQTEFFECSAGTFYDNLFVVAVNTGLRPGELFALTWDDIDLENMIINVDKTLSYQKFDGDEKKIFHLGPPKTESSVRSVPINDLCCVALKKQYILKRVIAKKNVRPNELGDRLFVTKYNTPLNSVLYNDAIKRILNEINLQKDDLEKLESFGGHTFRHTFATRCIENGVQPKVLQGYLGHADINMTMNLYVHSTEEFKQKEIKKLDNIMSDPHDLVTERFEKAKKVVDFCGVKMA